MPAGVVISGQLKTCFAGQGHQLCCLLTRVGTAKIQVHLVCAWSVSHESQGLGGSVCCPEATGSVAAPWCSQLTSQGCDIATAHLYVL